MARFCPWCAHSERRVFKCSLSAGGPILQPGLQALLVTPICPHDVSLRPLVLDCDAAIEVEISPDSAPAYMTCDGQSGFALEVGEKLLIRKSAQSVKWLLPE